LIVPLPDEVCELMGVGVGGTLYWLESFAGNVRCLALSKTWEGLGHTEEKYFCNAARPSEQDSRHHWGSDLGAAATDNTPPLR